MTTAADERQTPPWRALVRLEWRLTARDFFNLSARRKAAKVAAAGSGASVTRTLSTGLRWFSTILLLVVFHALGLLMLYAPKTWPDTTATRLIAVSAVFGLFTFMVSYTMSRVVAAFHERRDLDLLLASPIDPMLVLVIRSATIVVATTITFGVFVFPIANVGIVVGRFWVARWYPAVPLLAMIATAFALVVADLVVRAIGVRRARVGLQIFSALIGASFYFLSQARNLLPEEVGERLLAWTRAMIRVDDAPWPVRAVAAIANGDLVAWLVFVVASVMLFAGATWWARSRFVAVAQTPDASSSARKVERGEVEGVLARAFSRGPLATLIIKEWRLILRAPQLLSQVLLQVLYMLPLLFVAFRRADTAAQWGPPAFVAGVTGIASMLATALAWLTVTAEDAPDLLAGSPRSRATILFAKLVAGTTPPVVLVLLAAIGISRRSAMEGVLVLGFGTAACISAAILSGASRATGKRSDFQKRHRGRGLSAFVEVIQFILWAAAAGTAAAGFWIASVALTLVACVQPAIRLPAALRQFDD